MSTNMHNPADCRIYPDRWPRYRGKQLFEVIDDKSETGEEELLSVSHITGITPRSQKNVNMFQSESLVGYKRVQIGDIAANTMWTWQGAIGVSEYAGVVSPAYNVYRQRGDYYNPRFLDLLLREPNLIGVYHSLSTGIQPSRLRLYPGAFLSIDFPVPPIEEQEHIANYIDWKYSSINELIRLHQDEIVLLEMAKRGVINKALDSCFSDNNCMKRLKQVTSCNDESLSATTLDAYAFRYVDISSVDSVNGITDYEETTFGKAPTRARRVVHRGDVIISTVRTYLRAIALIEDDDDVIVSTGFAVLKPLGVNSQYLEHCLKSDQFCDEVMRRSKGVAYPAINASALLDIKIPVPPEDVQLEIVHQVASSCDGLNKLIEARKNRISGLRDLKASLLAMIVTGLLDIDSIQVPEYEHVQENVFNYDDNGEAED